MKFKFPEKLKIANLLYNKKFTVSLSIVLAFALWLGITMVENPIREQTFTDLNLSVSLNETAENSGLEIYSDLSSQKFTITVSGPNYLVSTLTAEDFIVTADTDNITSADVYSLDVKASTSINDSDLKIKSISPSTINLNVDYKAEKEFKREDNEYDIQLINVNADTSKGYILGEAIISDTQKNITVKGPKKTIEKIESIAAYLEVDQTLSEEKTFDTDVILYGSNKKVLYRFTSDGTIYDGNNNVVTNSHISLSPTSSIKVTQKILKQKEVDIKAKFDNLPSGLKAEDISFTLNKDKTTILGEPDVVDEINSIELSAIDFRQLSKYKNKFTTSIIKPDNVDFVENIESFDFDVTVDTSKYAETTLTIKDIRFSALSNGLKTNTSTQIRNVKICGPREIIEKIKADDLYAVINLDGKKAGTYQLQVTIKSDVFDEIWQVGTSTVSVTLK